MDRTLLDRMSRQVQRRAEAFFESLFSCDLEHRLHKSHRLRPIVEFCLIGRYAVPLLTMRSGFSLDHLVRLVVVLRSCCPGIPFRFVLNESCEQRCRHLMLPGHLKDLRGVRYQERFARFERVQTPQDRSVFGHIAHELQAVCVRSAYFDTRGKRVLNRFARR